MSFWEAMIDGFESNSISESAEVDRIIREMDADTSIIECDVDPFSAMLKIACESELNYNNIMNAVAMDEIKYLRETGEDLVWEAGKFANIKDNLSKWLDTTWEKIKGVIKKVLDKIDSWNKIDANFVKKWSKTIKDAEGIEISEFSGYDYNLDLCKPLVQRCELGQIQKCDGYKELYKLMGSSDIEAANTAADDFNSNADDYTKKARSFIVTGTTSDSIEDNKVFKAEIRKKLRGEDKVKYKTFKGSSIVIDEISSAKAAKKEIKVIYEAAKKSIAQAKKDLNKLFKSNKGDNTSKYVSTCSKAFNNLMNWLTISMHECINAIASNNRQNKAYAMAAIKAYKKKNKGSGDADSDEAVSDSFSFLDSVKLI